ncbi:DoxX [Pseudomonas taeanensis MS-3]|jgi:putative oxidoreductase|uniref:DoxX n=1 Tax=Pseudomonas taeanensis MS-3 TaxID=1395571 RepID=A0A0A1YDV3_9PSED|nr:DoxX family protein [Pseudomonas taeanensis]KFX67725.1 DoxX [Pseudomonas taeanensis MS-3]
MTHSARLEGAAAPVRLIARAVDLCRLIPYSLIAFIGRFSIAAVFWKSGQTKIQGLSIDIVEGTVELGLPSLSGSAVPLFAEEYKVPLLPPELAASLAAFGEHFFPIMILLGLATRFSALALLGMTLVIQLFVYPGAYPTHGVWAAVLLLLAAKGPGVMAIDHLIAKRYGYNR